MQLFHDEGTFFRLQLVLLLSFCAEFEKLVHELDRVDRLVSVLVEKSDDGTKLFVCQVDRKVTPELLSELGGRQALCLEPCHGVLQFVVNLCDMADFLLGGNQLRKRQEVWILVIRHSRSCLLMRLP